MSHIFTFIFHQFNAHKITSGAIICLLVLVYTLLGMTSCQTDNNNNSITEQTAQSIIFKGNDFAPDRRTSILIPGDKERLPIEDGISVSFDLKLRKKGDQYGNICSIVVDNKQYIGLILTKTRDISPAICLVANGYPLTLVDSLQESIYKWQHVSLSLRRNGQEFVIYEGDVELLRLPAPAITAPVRIFFGRSPLEYIPSIDVAPFELKDVTITTINAKNNKTDFYFELTKGVSDTIIWSKDGNISAHLSNPVWDIDTHSHWNLVKSLNFKNRVFPVYNIRNGNLYLITTDQVTRINLVTNRKRVWATSSQALSRIDNQFIAVGEGDDERLVFYDPRKTNGENIIDFDFERGDWSKPLTTTRDLEYTHHNKIFSTTDSSIIRMFGYGHHRYKCDFHRLSLNGPNIGLINVVGDTIPPRYLAAVGVIDSLIYIYGGVGNNQGDQEYGMQVFNDLYVLNPTDMKISRLLPQQTNSNSLAPSQSIVYDGTEGEALMLMFSPFKSQTNLSLKKINLATGELTSLGDTIPYIFNDVTSWADLLKVPENEELYAITVNYNQESESYDVKLYNISTPVATVITAGKNPQENKHDISLLITVLVIVAIMLISLILWQLRRNRIRPNSHSQTETLHTNSPNDDKRSGDIANEENGSLAAPGLYILNDFRAIGADGDNLTDYFSPILRQLLVVIAVYSVQRQNGISNSELKEFLWSDKSQESFINNRSVNIRKIRMLLEKIGGMDIVSSNGVWKLQAQSITSIDFFDIMNILYECETTPDLSNALINKVVKYARLGPLFPYMHNYWLDSIKASYSDQIISVLHRVLDIYGADRDFKSQLSICDILLTFDAVDENAVRIKCQSLIHTKRIGMAHATFKQFVREYETIFNDKWEGSFDQFVRAH